MLELQDISKSFRGPRGEVLALRDVSLQVGSGELVAIQGPSGGGKTTLLLIAGSLLAPDTGRVAVGGKDPYALSANERSSLRSSAIGFVFQQFYLVPYLSVAGNVLAPSVAPGAEGNADRAGELIRRFGLEDRADHVPAQLSTGEQQRVALARALLNRPSLILADEPTGNLDEANAKTILAHLKRIAGDGAAVLLVTHDPRAVGSADRVLQLRDGSLA